MHVAGQLTLLGWTMFALYMIAALLAFRTAFVSSRRQRSVVRSQGSSETGRIWVWLGAILGALGLNKPLDLQTRLIEFGRYLAHRANLLEYRLELHALFFLAFALVIIALLVVARRRLRALIGTFGRQLPLAAGGCALICAYVVIRAASIASVDQMLGVDLEKNPFLWLLEAGGLLLIIAQAFRKPDNLKS